MTVVAIWKEAGFFMIFYLAALQTLNPSLREAAAIEGASRWYFFRRVQWPLLMPTTLFVLVNAFINAFRMVDHLFVLTRGGPDNASTLLLYHLYEVGFSFWDTAYAAAHHRGAGGGARQRRAVAVLRARPQGALPVSALRTPASARWSTTTPGWLDTLAAWLLALLWILPLAYAVWTAFHPAEYSTRFALLRAAHARQLRARLGRRRRSRATSSTPRCWWR